MTPLGGMLLQAQKALALTYAEVQKIGEALSAKRWSGSLHMRYPGTDGNNFEATDVNALIEDMSFTINDDGDVKGGLMIRSAARDRSVLTWARFQFDGYFVFSESSGLVELVFENMEIVPNYSRYNSYPHAGSETSRMDASASDTGYGWPRCHGYLVVNKSPSGIGLVTTDIDGKGPVSMVQYDTQNAVTISLTADS